MGKSVHLENYIGLLCLRAVNASAPLENSLDLTQSIAFGGKDLDRCAALRSDSIALDRLKADERAQHLVLWRGKLLVDANNSLHGLTSNAPFLKNASAPPVFVGRTPDRPVFAHDVSNWQPPEGLPETLDAFHDPSAQIVDEIAGRPAFREIRSVMSELSMIDAAIAATAKSMLGWHSTHQFCAKCGGASTMSQAGWRRDCTHCNAQHFPRTDPVVIMLITRGNSVLLGRSVGWPDGLYSLLAGFVEPGETIEDAVRREVCEESRVTVGTVGYLASQPWPFPSSLMVGCWGEALTSEITLDQDELEDALWLSREDLLSVFAGQHPTIRPPRKGAIAGFLLELWLKDRLE